MIQDMTLLGALRMLANDRDADGAFMTFLSSLEPGQWTDTMRREAWRVLRKYKSALEERGLDLADVVEVEHRPTLKVTHGAFIVTGRRGVLPVNGAEPEVWAVPVTREAATQLDRMARAERWAVAPEARSLIATILGGGANG